MPTTTHVAIIDRQKMFRNGIIAYIPKYPDIIIDLEADDEKSIYVQSKIKNIDVFLVGIDSLSNQSFDLISTIKIANSSAKIVLIMDDLMFGHTMHHAVVKFMITGVHSCLSRTTNVDEIHEAISALRNHSNHYFSGLVRKSFYKNAQNQSDRQSPKKIQLTDNEIEVIKFICEEKPAKEMVGLLGLTPRTIEDIRCDIYKKTRTTSLAGIALYAVRNGIYEL